MEEIIPKQSESIMPQGIYLKYYCTSCGGDDGQEVTEDFIKELVQDIRNGDMQPLKNLALSHWMGNQ